MRGGMHVPPEPSSSRFDNKDVEEVMDAPDVKDWDGGD